MAVYFKPAIGFFVFLEHNEQGIAKTREFMPQTIVKINKIDRCVSVKDIGYGTSKSLS